MSNRTDNQARPSDGFSPPLESLRPTVVGSHYAISTGHPLSSMAASRVLECGGNAIDAGVTACLVANVVLVDMCNFGGIAPILVRVAPSNGVWSVSGVGTWGSQASLQAFRSRFGDAMPQGAGVSLVPAAPDAYITALTQWGSMSFSQVAEPAIELAEAGFILDRRAAHTLESFSNRWETTRAAYWSDGGSPPKAGNKLCQPDLATLLRRLSLAESGETRLSALENVRRTFYEGDIAARIVEFTSREGGWLTPQDLATFRSEVAPAINRSYAGWIMHTNDTWSQGPALLQALAILESIDLQIMEHNTPEYIHTLAQAIRLAFLDRERYYGDPRFVDVDLASLLSVEHGVELRDRIGQDVGSLPARSPESYTRRNDTTCVSVVDGSGNAFCAALSDTLDGGPVVPGLGIIVSPRGCQSRLDGSHPNALASGKRPRVTPAPAIAIRPSQGFVDSRVWTIACPGGDVILQAMLQVFLNIVHFNMTPQEAVEASRIATFSFPDSFYPHAELHGRLNVECRVPPYVTEELALRGHDIQAWREWEFGAGGVSLALDLQTPTSSARVVAAAADPRRSTYALAR